MSISLRFWGVRGSVPTPGPKTVRFGGNTNCIELRLGDEVLILDGGTGLRPLGESLLRQSGDRVTASILFSHVHWDHIQGVPFFAPVFRPSTSLTLYGSPDGESLRSALARQMSRPNFPVSFEELPASFRFEAVEVGSKFSVGNFTVRTAPLNHPQGCIAYRVEAVGRSIVYATDTEPLEDGLVDENLRQLAEGADILVHDAQYTPEEYEGRDGIERRGWGHSTWKDAARMAHAANVGRLVLFHHDPAHDDDGVSAIERAAQAEFPNCLAAREDLEIELLSCLHRRAA